VCGFFGPPCILHNVYYSNRLDFILVGLAGLGTLKQWGSRDDHLSGREPHCFSVPRPASPIVEINKSWLTT